MMWAANTAPATAYLSNDTDTNTTPLYVRSAPDSETASPYSRAVDHVLYMVGHSAGVPQPRWPFSPHDVFMAELRALAGRLNQARALAHRLRGILLPSQARDRRRRRGTVYAQR